MTKLGRSIEYIPESELLIGALAKRLYDRPVMDNRERGAYAEQLVASALDRSWRWVGLGWHPWDFERGSGERRLRIQVKQSAAKQIWVPRGVKTRSFSIPIRKKPSFFERDNPGEHIEEKGHFCEIFVFAWHGVAGASCDQRDPCQWAFYVVPEALFRDRSVVRLEDVRNASLAHSWFELNEVVEATAADLGE